MSAPAESQSKDQRFAVSLHSFGEATSVPICIRRAAFQVSSAPSIQQNLVQLELTVVNDRVQKDIAAKLNVPLPAGASVGRFEFLKVGKWFPAVPVEAKAAREVVYKEKEKGNKVGATSQKQGNVFEIEISPLGYNTPAKCRLWYSHHDASLPFDFDADTEIDIDVRLGQEPSVSNPTDTNSCVVGDCFGQRHFACLVPYVRPVDEVCAATPKHIAIFWDTSGSQEGDHKLRFDRLQELAAHCPRARFDVWTFGITFRCEVASAGVEEAIALLKSLRYDGGSDLTLLPSLLAAAGPVEAVLLFSDGMDSLDRQPSLQDPTPPVHCVIDQAKVSLRTLSRVSLSTGGRVLIGDYIEILRPQVLLTRISTDQADEAFFDPNDAFKCCPDHRLHVQWPVAEEGLWLCGTVGAVRKLTTELSVGGQRSRYHFDFANAPVLTTEAAPLLGYLFAQQQYKAVERDEAAMGMDLGVIRVELATRYGFCSPEASLLMLYDAEQFLEHKIACPKDHPAYAAWDHRRGPCDMPTSRGGLGQPKTDEQMCVVSRLARDLQAYMKNPIPQELLARKAAHSDRDRRSRSRERCVATRLCFSAAPARRMRRARRPSLSGDAPSRAFECAAECAAPSIDDECDECEESSEAGDGAAASSHDHGDASSSKGKGKGKGRGKGNLGSCTGGGEQYVQDCEAYVQGKEQDYLKTLGDALRSGAWQDVYADLRRHHGTSPSFFLYSAGLILEHDADAAIRICTNCLEINIQDVQMLRSVGYFLIKASSTTLGLAVLDRVSELAPVEPQSFLDRALARAVCIFGGRFCEQALRKAIELVVVVVTHAWADRFSEVEWPALILLHMLLEVGQRHGLGDLWPESLGRDLRSSDFRAGLVVWLGWDTDKTDIDLHVVEPSGNEVFYSNKRSLIGGHLSKDFTQGYGPEVYLLKDAPVGSYRVRAKYYASHQQSSLTGATSAVIWALRGGDRPELRFDTVRLDKNKEMMDVMTVAVAGETAETHELEFTDTDGDVVRLVREGAGVKEYVNGGLEIEGVQKFRIDAKARSYSDDTGTGSFRSDEDLSRLTGLIDELFAAARREAAATRGSYWGCSRFSAV